MFRRGLASAPILAGLLFIIPGVAQAEPRALLELFTSQGCSSCPPADKLVGEFARDPSMIVISLPMDIWDYLGWTDTLALPGHSARQRAYARLRGDREVYTPQIVVNGTMHVLGSDRDAIKRAVALTDRNPLVMSVPVLLATAGDGLQVTLTRAAAAGASGEVWLCPVEQSVPVAIGRGENRGHKVTYHNVVRSWRKLGEYAGEESHLIVPLSAIETGEVDGAVVMIQRGSRDDPGPILGAAFVPLKSQKATAKTRTSDAP